MDIYDLYVLSIGILSDKTYKIIDNRYVTINTSTVLKQEAIVYRENDKFIDIETGKAYVYNFNSLSVGEEFADIRTIHSLDYLTSEEIIEKAQMFLEKNSKKKLSVFRKKRR
ncbi:MAG: hypothetical protein RSA10_01705 [Bacilli bacterium]